MQLENLVYYNRLKNSKIVISDFHLAKLENGLIKEPCGTPEYLGEQTNRPQAEGYWYSNLSGHIVLRLICTVQYALDVCVNREIVMLCV